MNVKEMLKKTWNFLWKDDSFLSWIVFMVVIFIFIKFIFFPSISFLTGTSLPLVIVESCSMYHNSDFETWWDNYGDWYESHDISKEEFSEFSVSNGFTKGDIFLVLGVNKDNVEIGDVIIFQSGEFGRPIIHRVVKVDDNIQTKGDNNNIDGSEQFPFEKNIAESSIIGKATGVRIPLLGWIKLIFYEPFRNPSERGLCK